MSVVAVREAMANLCAAYDAFAACDVDALTRTEVLSVMDDLETLACRMPTQNPSAVGPAAGRNQPAGDGRQILERSVADPVAAVDG